MLELLLLAAYVAIAFTVVGGRGMPAIIALIVYLVVYDYAFLHLEAALGRELIAAKIFAEVLLAVSALAVFVVQVRRRVWRRLDFGWLSALAFVTVTGLAVARVGIVPALEDYRQLLAPLVLAALLALSVRTPTRDLRLLRRSLLALGIVTVVIAVGQFLAFDGEMERVWRHDFLLALKLEQDPGYQTHLIRYQIVRDGVLRASSVFISAIDFSIFAASTGVLAFVDLVVRRRWNRAGFVALSAVGVLVSQVRVGFIVLALGVALTLAFGMRSHLVRIAGLLAPLATIAAIFAYVVFGGGLNDPSSLGRLPQYALLLHEFTLGGSGFGSYRGRFDSFYIYAGLTLGAGALLLGVAVAWLVARLERVDRLLNVPGADPEIRFLARFALVQLLTVVVVFSVHHTVGSVTYFLAFLLAMLASRLDVRAAADSGTGPGQPTAASTRSRWAVAAARSATDT